MKSFPYAEVAALLATALLPAAAHAAIVFDNGLATYNAAQNSDVDSNNQKNATTFSLLPSGTVVDGAKWRGIYGSALTPGVDDFTLRIYSNVSNLPGTLLFTFNVGNSVNRVSTTPPFGGFPAYEYSATIPATALVAGTSYFMSIQNDTTSDADDDWSWLRGSMSGSRIAVQLGTNPWGGAPNLNYVLQLTGFAVPEPGAFTFGVVASSLGAAVVGLRRRG